MASGQLRTEIERRRTFAIISHPDAGKTTLTEKLLLYGGAIHLAGSVRARRDQRSTTSDWMELEQERGISISSTVLQFEYGGCVINLLDTPGHRDFSEDTYRVLAAVDSAVMVIDGAKGIEERTRKLFEICRLRSIPIFTFVNKLDRPARDPLALLGELEEVLGIGAAPVTWPLGSGEDFRGVYDRRFRNLHLYERTAHGAHRAPERTSGVHDPEIRRLLPGGRYDAWLEEVEMLEAAGEPFDEARVANGSLTPVLFGSALTSFGVQPLLEYFVEHGARPQPRRSGDTLVPPDGDDFSGLVFKVQANMDPRHRDRLSFLRVCSGVFRKDMVVDDPLSGRPVRLSYPQKLFGQQRESVDCAYPGDIVGLVAHRAFRIGDTLTTNPAIRYDEIPRFPPEVFAYLRNRGAERQKQLQAGLTQLAEEGVIQCFTSRRGGASSVLLGAVGRLQFDVVVHRLEHEYGAQPLLEPASFTNARWLGPATTPEQLAGLYLGPDIQLFQDDLQRPVLLFESAWLVDYFARENPELELHAVSPRAATAERPRARAR
ncbi:MAG: peptide chain release factor 3 [Deltaproteobacteria bacterium]|nr:peptide chain release factor 3 [Deltaproteobacteria bacterium]